MSYTTDMYMYMYMDTHTHEHAHAHAHPTHTYNSMSCTTDRRQLAGATLRAYESTCA
jgi:hypothetical protein